MHKVQNVYKHNWNCTNILPITIQNELLTRWLQCIESIPVNDDDLKLIETVCNSSWSAMKPITPNVYVYLMMLPNYIPLFAAEVNHIIWEFYKWNKNGMIKNLCNECFIYISKYYREYSANYWFENNWTFDKIVKHTVTNAEDILDDVIWDSNSWCSNCICGSLIEDIFEEEHCLEYENHHWIRERYNREHNIADIITPIRGSRICPNMYYLLKKNKWFTW